MNFQRALPGCCSVGLMYNHGDITIVPEGPTVMGSTSGHFIAIFSDKQYKGYLAVNEKHTLVSLTKTTGAYNNGLAICVFKWGKQ